MHEQNYARQEHTRPSNRATSFSSETASSATSHASATSAEAYEYPPHALNPAYTPESSISGDFPRHNLANESSSQMSLQDSPYHAVNLPGQLPALHQQVDAPLSSQVEVPQQSPAPPFPSPEMVLSLQAPPRDDDDLSSVCSDDSFLETERISYYSKKLSDAYHAKNWKDAKDYDTKLYVLLHKRNTPPTPLQLIDSAMISYMLGELADAKAWLGRIPMKKTTPERVIVDTMTLDASIAFRVNQYESALVLSHKAAKYARKFDLALGKNTAHYISRLVCLKEGDEQEAEFYRQMIQEEFIVPEFLIPLRNSMGHLLNDMDNLPWGQEPPEPRLPSRGTPPNLMAIIAGEYNYDAIKDNFMQKPQDWTACTHDRKVWENLLRLAITTDDDSDFACWLYRSPYMSDLWTVTVGEYSAYYPLQYAIVTGKTYAAKAIIVKSQVPEILESVNRHLKQPLQMAVDTANEVIVAALLKKGVVADAIGQSDIEPPLYKAAKLGHYNIARHLLYRGANPTCTMNRTVTLSTGVTLSENPLGIAIRTMVKDWRPNSQSEKIVKAMFCALRAQPDKGSLGNLKGQLTSPSSATYMYCFVDANGSQDARDRVMKLIAEYS
ncbi:hypothetical protein ABW21_db0204692 [Orbilia brochopaga]|nr:hypothetical protein ABW21_db0204692 [Drechslerella brochopaga]